jgi:hypothetical protein
MAELITLVGALVPTFLLGRLFAWLFRKLIASDPIVAILANVGSLAAAALILYLGDNMYMIWTYFTAQAIWLVVDLVRLRRTATAQ